MKTEGEQPAQPVDKLDFYSGDLNTKRIKKYRFLAEMYNVEEGTVRDIFSAGIDWAKEMSVSPSPERGESDGWKYIEAYVTKFSTGAADGKFRQLMLKQAKEWFDNEYSKPPKQ